MNITLQMKPIVVSAYTKDKLISSISGGYLTSFGSNGSFYRSLPNAKREIIRVYNAHKINAKWVQGDIITRGKNKGKRHPSIKVRDSKWIAYVYDFDADLLKAAGLILKQGSRNFSITRKG